MRKDLIVCLAILAVFAAIMPTLVVAVADQQYIWAISNSYQQKMMIFDYGGSTQGNVSAVEITPKGRSVSPPHSHLANINQGKMKIYERTSASQGSLNSEDSIKFESEIAEIANIAIYSPFFGLNIKGIVSISSWNATRNIKYSGKEINDRDATVNDLDQYGRDANEVHFLRNTEFSKERTFKSPEDFSIWAKTSGIAELKFDHEMNNENTLAKNELYNGKFNISMKNRHEFGWAGAYYIKYNDWLGGICETPCWDQDYNNIILIESGSFFTPISL